jgi:hypothetical protein
MSTQPAARRFREKGILSWNKLDDPEGRTFSLNLHFIVRASEEEEPSDLLRQLTYSGLG